MWVCLSLGGVHGQDGIEASGVNGREDEKYEEFQRAVGFGISSLAVEKSQLHIYPQLNGTIVQGIAVEEAT
jgi:uncharacterized UBP type Zn finger protein